MKAKQAYKLVDHSAIRDQEITTSIVFQKWSRQTIMMRYLNA